MERHHASYSLLARDNEENTSCSPPSGVDFEESNLDSVVKRTLFSIDENEGAEEGGRAQGESQSPNLNCSLGQSASETRGTATGADEQDDDRKDQRPHKPSWMLLGMMSLFLFLYVGCETGYGSYLAAYSFYQLGFSPRQGSDVTLVYWASFSLGRFVGIFVSMHATPSLMVRVDLAACVVTLVSLFSFSRVAAVLWIGSAVYGLAVATVYPSAIAWMSEHMNVSGKVGWTMCFYAYMCGEQEEQGVEVKANTTEEKGLFWYFFWGGGGRGGKWIRLFQTPNEEGIGILMCLYFNIYIYIEGEREKENHRKDRDMHINFSCSSKLSLSVQILSYLVVAACAGDAIVPMAEGFALSSSMGAVGFVLVAMVCAIPATLLFLLLQLMMNRITSKRSLLSQDTTELKVMHSEDTRSA